ncbi:molybdopterin-dependent oxidoreductase [Salipiger mucosus]|nr:molybdopterin-dependent oxidoreductase [Salipiger mucosus]
MRLFGSHFGTYEVRHTEAGEVSLAPFAPDPQPSDLGLGFTEMLEHPLRVARPAIRSGWLERRDRDGRGTDDYVEVDWDTALDLLAEELTEVRAKHGNRAIFGGSYGWASAGRFHHAPSQLKRFLNLFGGFTSSVHTYSFGSGAVILPHIFGKDFSDAYAVAPTWDQIAGNTDVVLSFGGMRLSNAEVESGGCGRHETPAWLQSLGRPGKKLIVFAPQDMDLPEGVNGEWVGIRPNTDCAVLLAIACEILRAGHEDRDFIEGFTFGFAEYRAYLLGETDGVVKDADWAGRLSGVPSETIRALAAMFRTGRVLINIAWSIQRADNGEMAYWAAAALAAITGQIGLPGGGLCIGLMAVNSIGRNVPRLAGPAVPQGRNPVSDFIPVARIADLLLRESESIHYDGRDLDVPRIELVYWCGGNPFHHHQDLNRLRRAFWQPRTVVVHEMAWTATARHADIVLPAALPLERDDLAVSSRDNWIVASRRAAPPFAEARSDHEIFAGLAGRLGLREGFTEDRSEMDWVRHLYEGYREANPSIPEFDAFWEAGYVEVPQPPVGRNPFADFRAGERSALATESGRIQLFSKTLAERDDPGFPGHPAWVEPREWLGASRAQRFPLHLLSPQPASRLHSQLDLATASQSSKIDGFEPVTMHPADAETRGLSDGDIVRVFNDRGACLAGLRLDPGLVPQVVSQATGAWYRPEDIGGFEALDVGGNPNTLTHDKGTSRLSGGPSANSCLVEIEAYRGPRPERDWRAPVRGGA